MTLLFLSDLHLDVWASHNRDPLAALPVEVWAELDALFVVGDLTNKPRVRWRLALARLAEHVPPGRIHILPGNHDYYDFRLDGDDRLAEIAAAAGVSLIQKREVILGGCRFLCCTLWTDFGLLEAEGRSKDEAMARARERMNDYRYIRIAGDRYRKAEPTDTARLHADHLGWIEARLAEPFAGDTIVVTHHAPHPGCLKPGPPLLGAAYASDLARLMEAQAPAAWIYGHTHHPTDLTVHGTRIRNVSLGYPYDIADSEIAHLLRQGLAEAREGRFRFLQGIATSGGRG